MIKYLIIGLSVIIILIIIISVIMIRRESFVIDNVKTIDDFLYSKNISHGILPNGIKVYSCLPNDGYTFPQNWPYGSDTIIIKENSVINGALLARLNGVPNNNTEWSVTIRGNGDQLLWISSLVPGKPYELSISGKKIKYTANNQGMVFLSDKPFPVSALAFEDISFTIPIGSTNSNYKTPYVSDYNTISKNFKDISIVVEDDSTSVVRGDKNVFSGCGIVKYHSIMGIYRELNLEERKQNVVGEFNLLSDDGKIYVTYENGKLNF